jgi:hypothetical protein
VNRQTRRTLRAAEQAASRLVETARKDGPLYHEHPRAVAQVSRTAKWLLNALATLERELGEPLTDGAKPAK